MAITHLNPYKSFTSNVLLLLVGTFAVTCAFALNESFKATVFYIFPDERSEVWRLITLWSYFVMVFASTITVFYLFKHRMFYIPKAPEVVQKELEEKKVAAIKRAVQKKEEKKKRVMQKLAEEDNEEEDDSMMKEALFIPRDEWSTTDVRPIYQYGQDWLGNVSDVRIAYNN